MDAISNSPCLAFYLFWLIVVSEDSVHWLKLVWYVQIHSQYFYYVSDRKGSWWRCNYMDIKWQPGSRNRRTLPSQKLPSSKWLSFPPLIRFRVHWRGTKRKAIRGITQNTVRDWTASIVKLLKKKAPSKKSILKLNMSNEIMTKCSFFFLTIRLKIDKSKIHNYSVNR